MTEWLNDLYAYASGALVVAVAMGGTLTFLLLFRRFQ